MGLTSKQKEYIHKNIKHFPIETLAENLDVEQEIIKKYLKKIWRLEKYNKYTRNNTPGDIPENRQTDFVFAEFFQKNLFIFIGLFFLIFVIYFNSLGSGFVSDDIPVISGSTATIKNFSNILDPSLLGSLQRFFHFTIVSLFGLSPFFFRLINVISHIGSVFLIFSILSIISKKRIAVFAAILFAVHPVLTETVVWISAMPYALSVFMFLISFFLFITRINKKRLFASYFFFFLALIASEKIIPLFLIFIIFEFIWGNLKNNWKKLLPYAGLSFIWAIIYISKIGQRMASIKTEEYQDTNIHSIFVQIPIAIINYLKLLLWPDKLSLYHTEMSFSSGTYIFMLFIFILFLAAIIFTWKKNKTVFFWLSFFLIALSPTLTPLGVSWIVAERYVYLGSIGIFVVVAIFFNWVWEKAQEKNEKYKHALVALFVIIILSLSIRTIIRGMDWKNEDTLWIATAKTSPSGQVIHNNLGDVYARQGNPEKAVEEFKKAVEINPRYADAYHNLGNTYRDMGKIDLAIENYQKALEFNPRLWQSYQNLAAISFNQGDFQKASEYIEQALQIDPQNKNLQENLQVIRGKIP
ncbi:MAG: tetratricopeptide repeat protein [Candidatus Moranbacteria bacterium]|nr:tetratricopeptide repeat protein [Candidatus Moranbacteria bacterium]